MNVAPFSGQSCQCASYDYVASLACSDTRISILANMLLGYTGSPDYLLM